MNNDESWTTNSRHFGKRTFLANGRSHTANECSNIGLCWRTTGLRWNGRCTHRVVEWPKFNLPDVSLRRPVDCPVTSIVRRLKRPVRYQIRLQLFVDEQKRFSYRDMQDSITSPRCSTRSSRPKSFFQIAAVQFVSM